jgi:hypothetical protein
MENTPGEKLGISSSGLDSSFVEGLWKHGRPTGLCLLRYLAETSRGRQHTTDRLKMQSSGISLEKKIAAEVAAKCAVPIAALCEEFLFRAKNLPICIYYSAFSASTPADGPFPRNPGES